MDQRSIGPLRQCGLPFHCSIVKGTPGSYHLQSIGVVGHRGLSVRISCPNRNCQARPPTFQNSLLPTRRLWILPRGPRLHFQFPFQPVQ